MKIRKLQKKDVKEVNKIISKTMSPSDAKSADYWFKEFLDPKHYKAKKEIFHYFWFFVAEEKSKIIGIVGLYNEKRYPKDVCWLGWFAVKPEHQGKGVGRALLGYVEKKAKTMGCRLMCIESSTTKLQRRSMKFYKSARFKTAGSIKTFYKGHGDLIYYYKKLR